LTVVSDGHNYFEFHDEESECPTEFLRRYRYRRYNFRYRTTLHSSPYCCQSL